MFTRPPCSRSIVSVHRLAGGPCAATVHSNLATLSVLYPSLALVLINRLLTQLTTRVVLQRFLTDEEKKSEHSRAHDVEWQRTLESRKRWLAGDLRLPDASSAEQSIWRKATLMSADDECLRGEAQATWQRSQQMTTVLKSQGLTTRGQMLHKHFPALPAASTALISTGYAYARVPETQSTRQD